jgi:hypothetical protein
MLSRVPKGSSCEQPDGSTGAEGEADPEATEADGLTAGADVEGAVTWLTTGVGAASSWVFVTHPLRQAVMAARTPAEAAARVRTDMAAG